MSTSDLTKFPAGTQDKGLNTFEPAIGSEVNWAEDTFNVTGGIKRGVGVRYGIAPLAGHSNTETPAGTATNGIQRSETTSGSQGLTFREHIYAIVPITMTQYDGSYPKANFQFYCYLVGLANSGTYSIDACLGSTLDSGVNKQSSTFVAGLAQSSYRQESPLVRLHKTELINLPLNATPVAADVVSILKQVPNRYWSPVCHVSVSGKRIPYQWMLAAATSTPDATTAPNLNLWKKSFSIGDSPTVLGGSPSEIITRDFTDNDQRILFVQCLTDDGFFIDINYTKQITQANTASVTAYGSGNNYSGLTGATKGGASTSYASVTAALINDSGSFTNSRHDAVLMAGEIPIAVIYQDWLQAAKGMMPRWVDLSRPACIPRFALSYGSPTSSIEYPSAFALLTEETLRASEPNTGILQQNIQYDVGFSYYNKLIDYETNVVFGASKTINTGTDTEENFALFIDHMEVADGYENVWEDLQGVDPFRVTMPWEFSNSTPETGRETGRGMHINDYEIRFYYRESGTAEWLPAGNFDAAQYWFYCTWSGDASYIGPMICTGPVGGTVGGQPNGFNDYSPLPKQRYICVQNFQNRAFWWSEKSMHFSILNNIYAYPLRNIVACPTGKWRGGIVHIRNGINQQVSRLVVFGDVSYSARFTGELTQANVRVSANTVGQFGLDGSDFRMDYLTDATAFSFRSAVVAEGILYWWGPQGVYRDDGITEPKKISWELEPNIYNYVDMGRDSEVHCVYIKRTREIVWFYPPKDTDETYPTYGLAYNVENQNFYPYKFRCQVDSSQNINIENDSTPDGVDGERVLLHCRSSTSSSVQRTFYFDDIVMAGEQGPSRELTVLTVATPSSGQRRLTLAAGSAGITASDIAADDLICIQNAKGYAPSLTYAPDLIAKIVAVNNGSNYIDIELPDGATWDSSASLTGQTAFPIYHRKPTTAGLNGISYKMQTRYWLPAGLSEAWVWQYLYFLFQYSGIPTPTDPFTGKSSTALISLAYRTLVCEGALTDILTLENNSADHCQIHHPLRPDGRAANGQALSYSLSGIHIGDPWTLEYLEAHCLKERGFTLKEFEG